MRHPGRVVWGALAAACGVVAAVVWVSAQDDDRSQIIVRSGSIIIDNGNGSGSGKPPTPWTHDTFIHEWKPQDNNYLETTGFDVTFEGAYATCGASSPSSSPVTLPEMKGKDVSIDYTYKKVGKDSRTNQPTSVDTVATVHFHLRRNHLWGAFGKNEPKLDDLGFTDISTQPPPASQELIFPAPVDGYISRIMVTGGSPCTLPPPPDYTTGRAFHVLIQPKTT